MQRPFNQTSPISKRGAGAAWCGDRCQETTIRITQIDTERSSKKITYGN